MTHPDQYGPLTPDQGRGWCSLIAAGLVAVGGALVLHAARALDSRLG